MDKIQEYLNISQIWYQKAENWKQLAEKEINHAQRIEYNTMSIQAAHKGWQFEQKAQEAFTNENS